jgi:hypothetical protein
MEMIAMLFLLRIHPACLVPIVDWLHGKQYLFSIGI